MGFVTIEINLGIIKITVFFINDGIIMFKRDIIVKTETQPNLKHEPNILGIMKSKNH